MNSRTVLLLEDDPDLSAVLAQLIDQNNICLQFRSLSELIGAKRIALNTKVAFLDIELGRGHPNGLEAFRWLNSEGYKGHIYFLTAHARNHPTVMRALEESDSEVLAKPVAPRVLLNLIDRCTG